MEKELQLLAGDIIFTQSPTFLGRLIRRFTRQKGEDKTEAGHCGMVTSRGKFLSNKFPSAFIVEALNKVAYHSMYKAFVGTKIKVLIYRPIGLTFDQKYEIVRYTENYIGATYGYGKLILHFFDWMLGNRQIFRRLMVLQKYPICSYLVAKAYASIDKDFGIKAKFASPDDICDFCQTHPKKYEKIWGWGIIK